MSPFLNIHDSVSMKYGGVVGSGVGFLPGFLPGFFVGFPGLFGCFVGFAGFLVDFGLVDVVVVIVVLVVGYHGFIKLTYWLY